ncbi:hypothetical protein Tco_0370603 [Tanacetum coccineum]
MEHGSENMKSPENIEEEDVDTQKEMKEVSKESRAKRKKSLLRKSTRSTIKRQKMEEETEKEDLKGYLGIVPREEFVEDVKTIKVLGINKLYPSLSLRNFDLEVMELENTQNNALAKLPMLKLGEYEMWEIRIKQYFQIQDYALWEVIENGNSWVPIPVTSPAETGTSTGTKMTVPSTAEEKTCKKNDVKARSLLLMALPNEHQLTFYQLQRLVSRLAILGVVTPPKDLNVKILRSLPSEWDTHVVVWINKPDFDTMGLDDLYNNFKIVEQKVKKSAEVSTATTKQLHHDVFGRNGFEVINGSLLSIWQEKFYQRTEWDILPENADHLEVKTIEIGIKREENQANVALMAFSDSEVTNDKSCSKSCLKNYEALKKQYDDLLVKLDDTGFKAATYKRGLATLEEQIIKYREHEVLFFEEIDLLKEGVLKNSKNPKVKWEVEPKKVRENNDAPIIKDWVSDDDEPNPKVEKKTVIPTATKKEFY